MTSAGKRAMPFWSSLSRVERILEGVAAYGGFEPVEMSWEKFRDEWLPELDAEGQLVGVNWSGARAVGYDVAPASVRAAVEAEIAAPE